MSENINVNLFSEFAFVRDLNQISWKESNRISKMAMGKERMSIKLDEYLNKWTSTLNFIQTIIEKSEKEGGELVCQ